MAFSSATSLVHLCAVALLSAKAGTQEACDSNFNQHDGSSLLQRLRAVGTVSASASASHTDRPIIGILTMPMSSKLSGALSVDNRSTYISAAYVSLYESAGARIAPIPFDLPRPGLKSFFDQVNGLVIPGGTTDLTENTAHPKFRAAAAYLLDLAMQANDAGIPFPVHGTCLGFEALAVLTAEDEDVFCGVGCFAGHGVPLKLTLQQGADASRLLHAFPKDLRAALVKENLTFNSHTNGMSLASFTRSAKLTQFWNLISTFQDLLGRVFVSTLEAKRYPITATQWHPEKPAYEFVGMEGLAVPRTEQAVAIGEIMARDFVAKARSNPHRFASPVAEEAALVDKRTVTSDPRRVFSFIYTTGLEGTSTYHEPVHLGQLPQYSVVASICAPSHKWLPMFVEIEMLECPSMYTPVSRLLASELPKMRNHSDVAEWLRLTAARVHEALKAVPASQELQQHPGRLSNLRSLNVKSSHDADDLLGQWNWEAEKTGKGELELSSPTDLSEEEAKFAVGVSEQLIGKFYGFQYSSFQSHVDGRCLFSEDRVLGLLLLWENYHDALQRLIQVRWRGKDFARSLSEGNPELLRSLQQRWERGAASQPLHELFNSHAAHIRRLADNRDGYRSFAVNVCHLLNIKCCQDCPKNLTPKFGGVEFRLFNTEFGSPMRVAMMLFQRLVQKSCSAPLEELRSRTLSLGQAPASDASPLFEFLGMDAASVNRAFLQSGAERWLWFCGGGARA